MSREADSGAVGPEGEGRREGIGLWGGGCVVMVDRSMQQFAWARCCKDTVTRSCLQQGLPPATPTTLFRQHDSGDAR